MDVQSDTRYKYSIQTIQPACVLWAMRMISAKHERVVADSVRLLLRLPSQLIDAALKRTHAPLKHSHCAVQLFDILLDFSHRAHHSLLALLQRVHHSLLAVAHCCVYEIGHESTIVMAALFVVGAECVELVGKVGADCVDIRCGFGAECVDARCDVGAEC